MPGFRARQISGPSPRRSITPGRKPSINTSALSTMARTTSTPWGFFRSTATLRRPRARMSLGGFSGSPPRTRSARSIRTTSAPMSDNIMPAKGPGPMPAISRILTPSSGPIRVPPCRAHHRRRFPGWRAPNREAQHTPTPGHPPPPKHAQNRDRKPRSGVERHRQDTSRRQAQ